MTLPQTTDLAPELGGVTSIRAALLRPLAATLILLTGYFLLPLESGGSWHLVGFVVGASLLITLCIWEIRHFLRSTHPVVTAVEMLAAVVCFYIVVFSATYFLLSEYGDATFNERLTRVDALYFCLTVFTTTGFGDIVATSQFARIAVAVQMASTLVLVGLGLRFVKLVVQHRLSGVAPSASPSSAAPDPDAR